MGGSKRLAGVTISKRPRGAKGGEGRFPIACKSRRDRANSWDVSPKDSRRNHRRRRRRGLSDIYPAERVLPVAGNQRAGELANSHSCSRRCVAAFWVSRFSRETNL